MAVISIRDEFLKKAQAAAVDTRGMYPVTKAESVIKKDGTNLETAVDENAETIAQEEPQINNQPDPEDV